MLLLSCSCFGRLDTGALKYSKISGEHSSKISICAQPPEQEQDQSRTEQDKTRIRAA